MWATKEATLMIDDVWPHCCADACIAGIAYLQPRSTPSTLMSIVFWYVPTDVVTGLSSSPNMTPALLYSTCSPPKGSTACCTADSTDCSSVTSQHTKLASPPAAAIASTASSPSARSAITTWAPSAANNSVADRPRPDAAPVTRATFPARRFMAAYGSARPKQETE